MVHIKSVVYIQYQSGIIFLIKRVVYIQSQSGIRYHAYIQYQSYQCSYKSVVYIKYQSGIMVHIKSVVYIQYHQVSWFI